MPKAQEVYSPSCFIALEGIDGSGTTTQLALLAARLQSMGHTVVTTCEPSTGPIGAQCRSALQAAPPLPDEALALMFAADRVQHLQACILPALTAGAVVLCDRYLMSTLAYQGLTLPVDWLIALNSRARAPDLTCFIDLPTQEARRRVAARGGVAEQFDAAALQAQIAARYRSLCSGHEAALGPVVTVDGSAAPSLVTDALMAALARLPLVPQVP